MLYFMYASISGVLWDITGVMVDHVHCARRLHQRRKVQANGKHSRILHVLWDTFQFHIICSHVP